MNKKILVIVLVIALVVGIGIFVAKQSNERSATKDEMKQSSGAVASTVPSPTPTKETVNTSTNASTETTASVATEQVSIKKMIAAYLTDAHKVTSIADMTKVTETYGTAASITRIAAQAKQLDQAPAELKQVIVAAFKGMPAVSSLVYDSIKVTGTTATVSVTAGVQRGTFDLKKEGGVWKINYNQWTNNN